MLYCNDQRRHRKAVPFPNRCLIWKGVLYIISVRGVHPININTEVTNHAFGEPK